ncbi:MAG: hypothetical protein GXP26_07820 [Planctomycetes bacterium]|nr:hypothetical protein [Planctomycetota bacterium]
MNLRQHLKFTVVFLGTACLAVLVSQESLAQQQEIRQPVSLATFDIDTNVVPASCNGAGCHRKTCSSCQSVCCPKPVEKEVKKHSWKVSPKLVCIPAFRWPWDRFTVKKPGCCDGGDAGCADSQANCGRVRCVNVLEKHEYTCNECGYEWDIKRVCTSSGHRKAVGQFCPECNGKGCD